MKQKGIEKGYKEKGYKAFNYLMATITISLKYFLLLSRLHRNKKTNE